MPAVLVVISSALSICSGSASTLVEMTSWMGVLSD